MTRNYGKTITLWVDGIWCICKDRIEAAVDAVDGLEAAQWEIASRELMVVVNTKDFDEPRLHEAVAAAGHDTREVTASDEAYDSLHGCCKYRDDNGWNGQFGIKATNFNKTSGQLAFDAENNSNTAWGAQIDTRRLEGWAKVGKVFLDHPKASIGLRLSGEVHDQDAVFGTPATMRSSALSTPIYLGGDEAHRIKTGASLYRSLLRGQVAYVGLNADSMIGGSPVEAGCSFVSSLLMATGDS